MARVLLLGGSGFIGRHVAEQLVREHHSVVIPTRRHERTRADLLPLPTVDLVAADIHDDDALETLLAGCDVAINLVGILHSRPGRPFGPDFAKVHVELPRRLAGACARLGVRRLLHMSALGAAEDAPSEYLRSRAAGEQAVRRAGSTVELTVFRPSVVYGPGDHFLGLFARLQRLMPVMAVGMAHARFQPVWVEDVARVIALAVTAREANGQTFELTGPEVFTLRELIAFAGEASGHARPIIELPAPLAWLQAWTLEHLPGRLLTRDNLRSMKVDSVSEARWPFGLRPMPLSVAGRLALGRTWPRSRFDRHRSHAGRTAG
jgi:NADH dehydrogenase